jgi:hypothetical protein
VKITSAQEERAVALVTHDVEVTLGPGHEDAVRHEASMRREFFNDPGSIDADRDKYLAKVAEEIQQYLHDGFVDNTWPECPFHRRHPLWLHEGSWVCEQSLTRVARLGELRASRDSTGRYLILADGDHVAAV